MLKKDEYAVYLIETNERFFYHAYKPGWNAQNTKGIWSRWMPGLDALCIDYQSYGLLYGVNHSLYSIYDIHFEHFVS